MTCVLPLVWKAWEKEEFFMGHELVFIPCVIKGRCFDGTRVLTDTFFSLTIEVFVCLCGDSRGKRTHTGAGVEVLQPVGRTCVGRVNEKL